jgi:hypothetical protein
MAEILSYFGTVQTCEVSTGDPETVNDATALNPLGILYRHSNGKLYRYVKFDNGSGNVASAAGGAAYWLYAPAAGVYTVTSDESDGVGLANGVAGVFGGVVTDQYYCFVQVGGVVTAAKTANTTTTVGWKCMGRAGDITFGSTAPATAATGVVVAVALTARTSTASTGTNTILLLPGALGA